MKKSTGLATSIAALAMSATAVFGASVHPNHPAAQTTVEATDTAEPTETVEPTDTPDAAETLDATDTHDATDATAGAGSQGAHGALVSVAAQDPTLVGGANNNHGGAVSAIARGSHGKPASPGKSGTHTH